MSLTHFPVMKDLKGERKEALSKLHDAAQIGDVDRCASIFSVYKEFSINIVRRGKNTTLHTALFHNQEGPLVDYLISNGADIEIENCKGYTPLMCAITFCKLGHALEKLVEAGAKYEEPFESGPYAGMTPLELVVQVKNERMIGFLTSCLEKKDDKVVVPTTTSTTELPKGRAVCPICNLSVRFPTGMSRIEHNQLDVERNVAAHGEYGGQKKKQKLYTSRKYLDEFLSHSNGEAYKKLCGVEYHGVENMRIRKEISESYGILHAVQECCRELDLIHQTNDAINLENIFLIDLCSGKGITTALCGTLFPQDGDTKGSNNYFLAVDRMLSHTVPHYFLMEKHVSYLSRDINSAEMLQELESIVHQQTMEGRTAILVGMHLCGVLSERAIEFFERIPDIKGIVLSPCCLPRKHEQKLLSFQKTKGVDPYPEWATYLKERVEGYYSSEGISDVRMYYDTDMHTEKNAIITGVRK